MKDKNAMASFVAVRVISARAEFRAGAAETTKAPETMHREVHTPSDCSLPVYQQWTRYLCGGHRAVASSYFVTTDQSKPRVAVPGPHGTDKHGNSTELVVVVVVVVVVVALIVLQV
ncbi:hypothetical protein ElyMa_006041600 [Elysia marginata]|uniref:Uncharacterized protein n=1 Tax=Elysia marginata TaxID=1093978 RepID=A0AAV4GJT3_9GAST|nr:hypothetical protein ElyMa_006041600 [Elysia marginata]